MRFKESTGLLSLMILAALPLKAEPVQSVHTTVELISDSSQIAPGQDFNLGVTFAMEPELHI